MKSKMLAYASYFVSFFLNELSDFSILNRAILFGSVARGEETKNSDVDIFIEINKKNKRFEKEVDDIVNKFYKSREALLFKSKGIDNKINVIVGKIDEWLKLKEGIESSGIVLYGPYIPLQISGKKNVIISWDAIGINRGAFLNKLYGYKIAGKFYKGLIEILNGKKLGKSTIMIPVEHRQEIFNLLKKYKVSAKLREVYA